MIPATTRFKRILTASLLALTTGLVMQTAQANPLHPPEAITILVPPPESPTVSVAPRHYPPPTPLPIPSQDGILPVPNASIPLGQVGDQIQANQLPPPPNSTVNVARRFRVFVTGEPGLSLTTLRDLAPGAFPSQFRGKSAFQVGSFEEWTRAEDMVQFLSSNGVLAEIEVAP